MEIIVEEGLSKEESKIDQGVSIEFLAVCIFKDRMEKEEFIKDLRRIIKSENFKTVY